MNALMPDFELHDRRHRSAKEWEGFAEVDRAIAENRLTAYRWKKAWADPLNRKITIMIVMLMLCVWAFIAGAGLGWW